MHTFSGWYSCIAWAGAPFGGEMQDDIDGASWQRNDGFVGKCIQGEWFFI